MVKSAERAIRILEMVARSGGGLTHTELCHALGIPSGSLTPLLNTLSDLGYIALNPSTKRYLLTAGILSLSRHYQEGLDIVRLGEPFLVELVEKTGEAAGITIQNGNRSTVVAKLKSPLPLSPSLNLGDSAPLYAGASGLIYLASRSDEEVERYLSTVELKPITARTPIRPDQIREELQAIRREGLSYTRDHMFQGISVIAAPIRDFSGEVLATFIISAPTARLDPKKEKKIERYIREASTAFSEELGFARGDVKTSSLKNRDSKRRRKADEIRKNHPPNLWGSV